MKEKKDMNDKMKDLQEKTAKKLDNADKKVNLDEMKNSDEMVGTADSKKRKRIRLAFCAAVAAVLIGTIGVFAAVNSSRVRSEEHSSELQSHLMISYAVFCLILTCRMRMAMKYAGKFLPVQIL